MTFQSHINVCREQNSTRQINILVNYIRC
uniref:Uncharacterized protein n=1 Tax=Arundo donax TaxID=35708 RepID=A0A0A8YDQ5_ARUDO